jgi:hypothetical protein
MRYLELAPSGSESRVAWSGSSGTVSTSQNLGAGAQSTANVIAQNRTAGRAATNAAAYSGGGLTDWFLPSYRELKALRTSGQGGPFQTAGYWTSSQYGPAPANAFTRVMSNGSAPYILKSSTRIARPIRAFGVVN